MLSALPEPTPYSFRTLHHWLEDKHLGNLALIGEDSKIWGSTEEPCNYASDLIVIRQHVTMDSFSKWIVEKFLSWFHLRIWHRVKKPDIEAGLVEYEDETILRYTSHTTTVIASLLPIISTIVLYHVQDVGARLGK